DLLEMRHRSGAAGGDQRHAADLADALQLLDVVAAPHAVLVHAVQDDLAGAAVLHLPYPVEGPPLARSGSRRVAGVLVDVVVAVALERIDADHDALRAEALREPIDQIRVLERRGVDRDLVRPEVQHALGVLDRADAAGDAERDVEHGRDAVHPAPVDGAAVRARGDVVEHELVRALVAVAAGEVHDVADDAVVAELHALDDRAVAD